MIYKAPTSINNRGV